MACLDGYGEESISVLHQGLRDVRPVATIQSALSQPKILKRSQHKCIAECGLDSR